MKVTYNWLNEFVNLKIPAAELADKLTMAGLEVVALEKIGEDFVLEIEITSNRPDWLSILGVAREVAALTGARLKLGTPGQSERAKDRVKKPAIKFEKFITVEDKKDCPLYTGRVIKNVKIAPSPQWLKTKIESLGCRSVNNVVDITNYVLFELGQPLHAFDWDKINQKQINVRRAKAHEKIVTLDGNTRLLDAEILIIADAQKPLAIAGIMGGQDAEVTPGTVNVLLESAMFDPLLVRRAKQKLGLQSESAYRFERGVDLEAVEKAAQRAQDLILALAGGELVARQVQGAVKVKDKFVKLDKEELNKLLGTAISRLKIEQILKGLELPVVSKTKNTLTVKIPSFRQDLKLPIDLIEEVARIYGYARIRQTLPAVKPSRQVFGLREFSQQIKNILSGLGITEAITYSLIDRQLLTKAGVDTASGVIEILNPLSKEQEILRPELFPSLLRALAFNLNQQQERVSIFELAHIYLPQAKVVTEVSTLGMVLCGANTFFTKHGRSQDEITLLHLKGVLEALFSRLGIKNFSFSPVAKHKIEIRVNQMLVGFVAELTADVLSAFDIKNRQVVLAQVDLEKLFYGKNSEKKFLSIPKYPSITRDISFLVQEDIPVQDLLAAISSAGAQWLELVKIVDYYQGKQIPAGHRGLTVSCIYRLPNRTLTEQEVSPVQESICALLKEQFGISLRTG